MGTLLTYGLFALLALVCIRPIFAHASRSAGVVLIISALAFAFTVMVLAHQGSGNYYLAIAGNCLFLAAPWLLVLNAVTQPDRLLRYLSISAVVILAASALRLYLPIQPQGNGVGYSQYDGYQALPAAVILADAFGRRPRVRSGLLFVLALGLVFAAGARGPLLALVVYIAGCILVAVRRRPQIALIVILAVTAVVQWFDVAIRATLRIAGELFPALGFSTRTLNRLISGSFFEDRVRDSLAGFSWRLIFEHPTLGVGIARDRFLLAEKMGVLDPSLLSGWYPHNIALEMLLQYGIFVGTALLVAIGGLAIGAVLNETDPSMARVVLIFVGIGLWPLLVSGSYLISPLFFGLLGICLASRRRRRLADLERRQRLTQVH